MKAAICKQERELSPEPDHAATLVLDFPASRTLKNECLSFKLTSL